MTRILSPFSWTMVALITFLLVVFLVTFVEDIMLVGECGLGPAAPSTCTWKDVR